MPNYQFECPECKDQEVAFRYIIDRNQPFVCSCGVIMKRIPTVGSVTAFIPYMHHNLDTESIMIRTSAQEREIDRCTIS